MAAVLAKIPVPKDGKDGKDGLPGLDGGVGPIGPEGPQGPPGDSPEIDYEKLAIEVVKRLPPIYIPAEDGKIEVYLGDELPPMKFIVTTEEGKPTQTPVTKHLGELVIIRMLNRDLMAPPQ